MPTITYTGNLTVTFTGADAQANYNQYLSDALASPALTNVVGNSNALTISYDINVGN